MYKKKILIVVICLLVVSMLTACNKKPANFWFFKSDQKIADETIEMLLEAIENSDSSALRSLFAENIVDQVDGFEGSMAELFEYYQGNYVSFDNHKGTEGNKEFNNEFDQSYEEFRTPYDIVTETGGYRIAFLYRYMDSLDSGNIGIWSLYILNMEDDDTPEQAYWGDGKDTWGINVGIENVKR